MTKGAIVACALCFVTSPAWATPSPPCVQPLGMDIGEIVPTADAARELYKTISGIRHAPINPSDDIRVNDEGDHWEVYQYPKHIDESVHVANGREVIGVYGGGGGTLNLEIKKCDASTVGYYAK